MSDSGRKERILEAAREVFLLDPAASMATVAERAGVGMSALYRRYPSKDVLLGRLAADGLRRYIDEVEAALADAADPWTAFTGFMRRCVDGGTGAMTQRLSGQFTATREMYRDGRHAHLQTEALLARMKAAGVLREDVQTGDLTLIFELMQSLAVVDDYRSAQLRRRYLTLLLDSMRLADSPPLPGPPPLWEELSARYRR
jgi:AcrR family transcriptional regulator